MNNSDDIIAQWVGIGFWVIVIISLTLTYFGSRTTDENRPATYIRTNSSCDVVVDFENCCGVFKDRYIITKHNRYKIHDNDNIVIGDSLCRYEWSAEIGSRQFRVYKDSALQYGLDDDMPTIKPKIIQMLKDNGFVVTEGKTGWGIFGLSYIEISWE